MLFSLHRNTKECIVFISIYYMKTTDDLLKYILLESDGLMILICLSSSKAMLYNSMS